MTENTRPDRLLTIGELSRLTGVPVRTIRFYCDEGILEPLRSAGGHRLFDPTAAPGQLALVRSLRMLGLGLTAIVAVLTEALSVADAVAQERSLLETELGALSWRHASLAAVEAAAPAERLSRLALLAAVHDRRHAHDRLIAFWRRLLAPAAPTLFDDFAAMNIPAPPTDPAPRQVAAYAELVAETADPRFAAAVAQQLWRSDPAEIRDKRELLAEIAEVCMRVEPLIAAQVEPRPGAELNQFIAAHARARGVSDTPDFRRRLCTAVDTDFRVRRYWARTAEILGTATTGAAQQWLHHAVVAAAGLG
ncbi:MAG: MerR family transcriptional regulator [Mycobacteriaceae bacterium]|nr:MerR family transcriptional regulator [Mycobacteriaceae bacterium]